MAEHKEDNKRFVQSVLDMIHMDDARISAKTRSDVVAQVKPRMKRRENSASAQPSPYKVKPNIPVGGGAKIRGTRKRGRNEGAHKSLSIDVRS